MNKKDMKTDLQFKRQFVMRFNIYRISTVNFKQKKDALRQSTYCILGLQHSDL